MRNHCETVREKRFENSNVCAGTRGEWKISWCTQASSSSSSSSLFRTAAAVVWLLSIFQNRRGKRDKPEDVASTCPVSVKTHLQAWLSTRRRGRWREGERKKKGEEKLRRRGTRSLFNSPPPSPFGRREWR